jgi:hypothetical protein
MNKMTYLSKHRRIARNFIGRELRVGEQVHHIDGNHENNEPTNLIVCSTQTHNDCHIVMEKDPDLYNFIMKGMSLLFIVFLILPNFIKAEQVDVDKTFNFKIEDDRLYITSDGVDYQKKLSTSKDSDGNCQINGIDSDVDFSWMENVTCESETYYLDLKERINGLYSIIPSSNTSGNYYERYVDCNGKLASSEEYKKNNEDKTQQVQICNVQLNNIKDDARQQKYVLQGINETNIKCQDNLSNAQGLSWLGIFASSILLIIVINWYLKYVKKKTDRNKDPDSGTGRGYNP